MYVKFSSYNQAEDALVGVACQLQLSPQRCQGFRFRDNRENKCLIIQRKGVKIHIFQKLLIIVKIKQKSYLILKRCQITHSKYIKAVTQMRKQNHLDWKQG
ncbi:Hypothetical_protein [Hexamita inflata]|uniref:Hypothetical_protein n=1 Tax=Hexamita inflata TaxID=28002 RepID=A0AA86Q2Y1_9EUKA|nr:Hypothetical protein HINF_LOCUS33160 [Hexamita inflata]